MPHAPRLSACLAVATLLLAGCSGAEPSLGADVAEDLAQRADGVAAALAEGDGCLALDQVSGLRSATATARDAGEVPDTVAAEVLTTAERIEQDTTCEPPPPPEPDDDDGDDDDGGDGDDDEDEEDDDDDEDDDRGPPEGRGRGNGPGRSDD